MGSNPTSPKGNLLMALTLTTADSALKEWYLPALRNQLNNDTPMLNIIGQRTVDVEGRRAVLSLKVSRSASTGSRLEGGTLPTAGNQAYAEERVSLKSHYHTIQVSGQTIKLMDSNRGAFVRAVESEMQGAKDDISRDMNRQLWGTSNGVLATCGTTSGSTTVQLAAATPDSVMRAFFVGETVDIGTVAQLAAGSGGRVYGATISAIDATNKTITIGSSITTNSSDFVSRAGNGGATTSQREVTGLQSIVASSGSLYNVDPATYPIWVSTVDSNSGTPRSISENLLAKNVQQVQLASGMWPTHIITSDGVHRAFAALLQSQKRYPNTRELPGGYTGLDFAAAGKTLPVVYDRDCPSGTTLGGGNAGGNAFILNADHLFLGAADDWEWMQEDGAILSRVVGVDAYGATLFRYCEQFTDQRNTHGKVADITEA